MAPHCNDWMAEPPARPLVPWLRRILSMSRQIQDSIFCAIQSCNPRHCRATRQKQSQTVAYAHLRWGLVIRGRSAIPAGCIGLRWFFIDSRVRPRFTHALLERAQPQRLKPIEFWPNGTTEVVPFPKHWAATFGVHELARLFTGENAVGCQLTAIAIEGPRRGTSSR